MVRFLFLFVLLPVKLFAQDIPESKDDSIAYAIIDALPEIKKFVKEHKDTMSRVSMWIVETDSASESKLVQVGIVDNVRFAPMFNFYVNPKTAEVKYLDTFSGSLWSLKRWRKQNK